MRKKSSKNKTEVKKVKKKKVRRKTPKTKIRLWSIYLLTFLYTLHFTPAIYIDSTFLKQFVSESSVGLIYSLASALSIISLLLVRPLLRKYGIFKVFMTIMAVEFLAYLSLASEANQVVVITAFCLGFVSATTGIFCIDILLDKLSKTKETGSIRGIQLTAFNASFLIGPIIATLFIGDEHFWKIYLISTALILPLWILGYNLLRDYKDPKYSKNDVLKGIKIILKKKETLGNIFTIAFILRFFYSWMVIYTPIFLHSHLGFSVADTTMIIAIALIPFVLLQGVLGKIADTKLGEKEILIAGTLITGFATVFIGTTSGGGLLLWGTILFVTRIGAAMIEVMSETYLFKKIDGTNITLASLFRMVRPIAYIVAPIIGSVILYYSSFEYLYIALGSIILSTLWYSIRLKDTN